MLLASGHAACCTSWRPLPTTTYALSEVRVLELPSVSQDEHKLPNLVKYHKLQIHSECECAWLFTTTRSHDGSR